MSKIVYVPIYSHSDDPVLSRFKRNLLFELIKQARANNERIVDIIDIYYSEVDMVDSFKVRCGWCRIRGCNICQHDLGSNTFLWMFSQEPFIPKDKNV
jgi:hypothetical protein